MLFNLKAKRKKKVSGEKEKGIPTELRDWINSSRLDPSTPSYTPSANCAVSLTISLAQEWKNYTQELSLLPLRSKL